MDNCCFNRPFDDQSQIRIRLESEAKLKIQDDIIEELTITDPIGFIKEVYS